jgi:molybdate transport system ATP-binding protein
MSFDLDVTKRIGGTEIRCKLAAGDGLTVLFGPSGVGKTTVLNMVAGLIAPDSGHVRVGEETLFDAARGIDVPVEHRRAGYVFQSPRLFPHRDVRGNLLYGFEKVQTVERYAAFERLTAVLGIDHLLDRWPKTLSGGEARRVAIGRALLSGPHFLLLDEPLSSLDRARREEIMGVIERLRDGLGLPILMVTHDAAEAERLGTRIIAM